jgi:hypothetical protein
MWSEIKFLFGTKGRDLGSSKWLEHIYLIRNFLKILILSRKTRKARRLVIGNILNPWMRFLVSRSSCREVYVLDDGNASIPILNQNNDIHDHFRIPSSIKVRKNILLKPLQNAKIKNNRLHFFTLFNHWGDIQTLRLIPNNFQYLKNRVANYPDKGNDVIFIGSPLVEFNLISEKLFMRIMKYVATAFKDHHLQYFRHRTEKIAASLEMEQILPDRPLEHIIINMPVLPCVVLSFFSTAGINLNRIYGSKLKVINLKIDESHIENIQYSEVLDTLAEYYRKIENEHFQIFEMNPDQDPSLLRSII